MSAPGDPHGGDEHEAHAGHLPRDDQRGPRPTQRQMLATYLGFDQQPPVRPSWWADLLWVIPIELGLLYLLLTAERPQVVAGILLVVFSSVIVYMTAVRVRFTRLLDQHPELRQPQREPVVRRRQPPGA